MEAPLPPSVLAGIASAEVHLEASPGIAVLGPLLELRRALWVPIQTERQLRGLVLAGVKRRSAVLAKEPIERAAAELALALEHEQEQRKVRDYHRDLSVARELLLSLGSGASPDTLLTRIVQSCLTPLVAEAPLAVFAAIGVAEPAPASTEAEPLPLHFAWTAGDAALARLQSGPLSKAWLAASQGRRVVGIALESLAAQGLSGRAVALPLTASGHVLGVLVAILPPVASSLATLERLELRAALAAAVLAQRWLQEERRSHCDAQRSALRASAQAVLLIDREGIIRELSAAAGDLFVTRAGPAMRTAPERIGLPLANFFRHSERDSVAAWLQRQARPTTEAAEPADPLEAELENGSRVRVHSLGPALGASLVLFLEPAGALAGGLSPEGVETELHNVIEWLEEGVLLFDAHENVRAMNIRFEQMAGLSSEESGKYKHSGRSSPAWKGRPPIPWRSPNAGGLWRAVWTAECAKSCRCSSRFLAFSSAPRVPFSTALAVFSAA